MPLTCSSIGTPTVSATVFASAPGYEALTVTDGGVIDGYWATGSVLTVIRPAMSIMIAMTVAKMGRLIKNLDNTLLEF